MAKAKYCPDCGEPISFGSSSCACGWKDTGSKNGIAIECRDCSATKDLHRCGDREKYYLCTDHYPIAVTPVSKKFKKVQLMIDAYVADYQTRHIGASKREACMAYAKDFGVSVPPQLAETEDQREARTEREAIMSE